MPILSEERSVYLIGERLRINYYEISYIASREIPNSAFIYPNKTWLFPR
jgi:hypothetical protein